MIHESEKPTAQGKILKQFLINSEMCNNFVKENKTKKSSKKLFVEQNRNLVSKEFKFIGKKIDKNSKFSQ